MTSLVHKLDPVLRTPTERFDFNNPPINPVELYNELGEYLKVKKGFGLAANQIGYPYRVFVIWTDPIRAFFNPTIIDQSEETVKMEEACLTFPGISVKVTRPKVIKVRFADPTGKVETQKFQDMTARVICHEIEHLDGKLFTQNCSDLELTLAINRAKKLGYNYIKSDLK